MTLSIRTRLVFIVLVGGLACIGVSILAWKGIEHLHSAMARSSTNLQAVKNHMEGDMMHDALRGDVSMALLHSLKGDEQKAAVLGPGALPELPRGPRERTSSSISRPSCARLSRRFTPRSRTTSSRPRRSTLSVRGPREGPRHAAAFEASFEDLEARQEVLSEPIESSTADTKKLAEERFESTRNTILGPGRGRHRDLLSGLRRDVRAEARAHARRRGRGSPPWPTAT